MVIIITKTMIFPSVSSSSITYGTNKHLFSRSSSSVSLSPLMLLSIIVTSTVLSSHAVPIKASPTVGPTDNLRLLIESIRTEAHSARTLARNLTLSHQNATGGGLEFIVELLDDSVDQLDNVLRKHRRGTGSAADDDVHTWLSAVLTNHETCKETLKSPGFSRNHEKLLLLNAQAENLFRSTRNSLALYVSTKEESVRIYGGSRKLLGQSGNFPTWVGTAERRLLETPVEEMAAEVVVAKDGTGTHKTVAEALAAVSAAAAGGRTVIHVTAGTYQEENLKIPTRKKDVMLVGDGKGKTIIVGSKSSAAGTNTYDTATFGVAGDGFIARDISFVNNAGPGKRQAVALRVSSDRSVFFQCSIEGYQDTLYTLSKRQFYRNTDIYGTVDFIFGNSAAVFQSCNMYIRIPQHGLESYVTAQGRDDPNQNTGFSIHNCRITAAGTGGGGRAFLGRPWKEYSRTVVMQSFLSEVVNSAGWAPWDGGAGLKTLYYGEYMNSGPGASTGGRVKWPGYHAALTPVEAGRFTVSSFISGNLWLPSTGVAFDSGLL